MKNVLIVGASGGIGSAILDSFYGEYNVFATSTRQESIELLAGQYPQMNGFVFDHTARKENELIKSLGVNLDCLVIASGITSDALSIRLSDELWDKTLEVNLSSSFRIIKHAYLKMNAGASIILLSSVVARMGNVGQVAYAASKGGVESMVKTLSREFASKAITVNAVAPGFIATKMTAMFDEQQIVKSIPLKRMGQPREVAIAVKFLATAGYITGHTLEINGGLWMN